MSELACEDFSILMGPLAQMFKVHVQENGGKLILIPSRGSGWILENTSLSCSSLHTSFGDHVI